MRALQQFVFWGILGLWLPLYLVPAPLGWRVGFAIFIANYVGTLEGKYREGGFD